MLAEVAARIGRTHDAENLLKRCVELAPGFRMARQNYAMVLHRQNKWGEALQEVDHLLVDEPANPGLRNLKAAVLGRIGEYEPSIDAVSRRAARLPKPAQGVDEPGPRAQDGQSQRGEHRGLPPLHRAGAASGRGVVEPREPQDVPLHARGHGRHARAAGARGSRATTTASTSISRWARRSKTAKNTAQSFEHYAQGNALRRKLIRYDAEDNAAHVARSKRLFTREFFAARAGWGCEAPDPIFIVGLPRAGSTLVEQILASHSSVEGTQELPDVTMIARMIANRTSRAEGSAYPRALEKYSAEELRGLGERYLEQTRIQRKTSRPFFIDKMPNNFAHVGLIHLMLPNAKIIDARRHPLGCCFSCFKQHFARGQTFTYDLDEIGRYYRDYVELMAHFDAVLPGRVHRVFYENMVENTEAEVRRLLDYCGLPFEPDVLRFHENQRAVRTASSEQVRKPIFREGLDQWRHFDPWLDPLKSALGDVLERYPAVPQF